VEREENVWQIVGKASDVLDARAPALSLEKQPLFFTFVFFLDTDAHLYTLTPTNTYTHA
jgi:hypothetical protein